MTEKEKMLAGMIYDANSDRERLKGARPAARASFPPPLDFE